MKRITGNATRCPTNAAKSLFRLPLQVVKTTDGSSKRNTKRMNDFIMVVTMF
jgi:hypothetical protein